MPLKKSNWLDSIHHDGSSDDVSNLIPALNENITVRLRMRADAPVSRVLLRTTPDGEQAFTHLKALRSGPWVFWEGVLSIHEARVNYRFLLLTAAGHYFYNTQGLCQHEPLDAFDFKILANYAAPAWVKTSVFYQINPDTWRNERADINPRDGDYQVEGRPLRFKKWGELLKDGEWYSHSYYGGDLHGVKASLPYLRELGINALYLNPVFKAFTTHRYDTADYDNVDPYLGGNAALQELNVALKAEGMRYILDIVPNHCGRNHPWFLKALSDPAAPEMEFFHFTHYPDEYHCWGGFKSLVKLNYASAELRRRMYGPGDSALRRWLRDPYQLDGWRVDVSNMLGRDGPLQVNLEVLREMRLAVKAENPDAYFMGENFQDATDQLQGDIWDGVMNYSGFFTPLVNWLTGFSRGALGFNETIFSPQPLTTAALVQSWKERLGVVPWVLNLQQFNMLGSHDTTRITSMLKDSLALYHLALGFQMTFPGVPCVFYGNEIGMLNPTENSAAAAGARTCMEWDSSRWDMHSLALYRELIALRRQRKALADGGFQLLRCAADGFIYQRKCGGDVVLFTANRAAAPWQPAVTDAVAAGLPDGLRLRQFRGNQRLEVSQQQLRWPVLPQGGIIWLSE